MKLKRNYDLDAPKGVQRPQQRQHADQEVPGLGAEHPAPRRPGKDLRWIYDQYVAREQGRLAHVNA